MMCGQCERELAAALVAVWTYHGLAHDLDIALARQAVLGERHGSRSVEKPLLFNERASDAGHALKATLVGWARAVHEETGADLPADTLTAIARWLHHHIGWLRHHEAAEEIHAEIIDAVRDVRRAIDRPVETVYVGPCECGEHLFACLGERYVTCPNREAHEDGRDTWSVADRIDWLLAQAEDVVATATQISAALTHYNRPVTPAALRGYVRRGRLAPVWCTDTGNNRTFRGGAALYRLGDVMDVIAPTVVTIGSGADAVELELVAA